MNQGTNTRARHGDGRKCYECGEVGHIKKECPKLKSQGGIGRGRAFVIGSREAIQDPSVVSGTFLIDNLYAAILFDSGADRSFITPTFTKLLSHKSSRLKEIYEVEIANGQTEKTHEILEKFMLTLNNYPFHVNLMSMPIDSFDVIIGMDWLYSHRAEILCHEKAIRIPLPNGEALIIYGDKCGKNLKVISCTKTQKYLHKKCSAFLAHIVDKKRKTKEIKDIPQVCDFPNVFPKDLPEIPPVRQVEFRIDLIPGATPVAKSAYRLAPSEMQEFHQTNIKGALFEALYGRKCPSPICWAEVGDSQMARERTGDSLRTGPEIIHETTEKIVHIKDRLKVARDREKSYADVRRKPLEFQVRDKVMVKVSPW
ncbi:uncharacterized protein LOC128133747 [Lactuca sativa]|uniref:uncharacterized protein LOC128133747 n=1 Tax=Lactuca sativa TaxID=4236 RepID=UPI0022AFCF97|nr:uncharacterized protein LOC128133747 [Lactuca sativa]